MSKRTSGAARRRCGRGGRQGGQDQRRRDRLRRAGDRGLFRRPREPGHLHRHRRARRSASLRSGGIPIYEPGLEELVERNVAAGRLRFTTELRGRPGRRRVRLRRRQHAAPGWPARPTCATAQSAAHCDRRASVSAGDHRQQEHDADRHRRLGRRRSSTRAARPSRGFAVVSNPEFLREGSAVADFMQPDRVVLGSDDPAAAETVAELYQPLDAPVVITDLRTAEMIKYASNAFLATKISFINEIASICEQLGADVKQVARGMGLDAPHRRGVPRRRASASAAPASRRTCRRWRTWRRSHGCHPQLLRAVLEINRDARRSVVQKLRAALGQPRRGDDRRARPGVQAEHRRPARGRRRSRSSTCCRPRARRIRAYDPAAMEKARRRCCPGVTFGQRRLRGRRRVPTRVVLVTEWNEFKQLDMARVRAAMAGPLLIDGRNVYDPDT